jgi:lactonase
MFQLKIASFFVAISLAACTTSAPPSALQYNSNTRSAAPIPAHEQQLPTALAQPYFKVSDKIIALESPLLDPKGNLLLLNIYEGKVLKLTPAGQLSTVFEDRTLFPAGMAMHKDGRIFLAGLADYQRGKILAIQADGSQAQEVVGQSAGLLPDDLVFDTKGGIYFTDFRGTSVEKTGGIYYIDPQSGTPRAIVQGLSNPNGIALSPDGKVLWSTEFGNGRLHRMELDAQGQVAHFGSSVPYYFTGRAPDSIRTDADGNVYVAMYSQARVLVFSRTGIPIGQVLLPGRDEGKFLKVTSMVLDPDSTDMYIVARDDVHQTGSMIFKAQALAKGTRLYSHQ